MAATIVGVFQPEMQNIIKESKILLVGAGGIGCEVLKNLVLMGFSELEVIDLDTIEVSNLNRQFLFSKESVGKAKSHVAKASVLKFNPNVNITSHLGDIIDTKYGMAFFNKFKLVINALDNKKARIHVNRMCLACNIPLIESGMMGYNGQVELIKKGLSSCYECLAKPEPKSYPMCTIRNTPKEPIHCIVWSKFLFGQLFGNSDEDVSFAEKDLSLIHDDDAKIPKMSAREWAIQNDYNPKKLLKKVFFDDIQCLLNMPDLYANKKIKPVLLDESLLDQEHVEYSHLPDNEVLSVQQFASMFLDCLTPIKQKLEKSKDKCLIWDKDDDDFMNFIVSSTNIRSAIFKIPLISHFDIKSMAGNIIPAVATANAMVAGQIVIHTLRILRGKFERCQSVYLRGQPNHKGVVLCKDKRLEKPNPKCNVCSTDGEIILSTDISKLTVMQFDELVLKKRLNMVAPDVLVDGRMIISSDEDDELDMYEKTLEEVGVTYGSRFSVDDYFQNYSIKITLYYKKKIQEEDPDFEIFSSLEELLQTRELKNKNISEENENDDCIIETIKNTDSSVCDNDTEKVNDVITTSIDTEKVNDVITTSIDTEKVNDVITTSIDTEKVNDVITTSIDTEKANDVVTTSIEQVDDELNTVAEEDKADISDSLTEAVLDQEIGNEEILATKRKADLAIEDINGTKKSRID